MKKTFLISPVRGKDPQEYLDEVIKLEESGWKVYWPARDTNQNDTEMNICNTNRAAITESDCVHVIWERESRRSLFDLGSAWALLKPIVILEIPGISKDKGFRNLLLDWERRSAR